MVEQLFSGFRNMHNDETQYALNCQTMRREKQLERCEDVKYLTYLTKTPTSKIIRQ